MGGAVAITRVDLTAAELRTAAGREKNGSAARRILALAMVLDGADRKSAAETCGMDRQTLRDWVHRYNAEGLRGLHDLKTPGPKPKLTAEQQAELAKLVEAGPDPTCHGVVRWRRVDHVAARLAVPRNITLVRLPPYAPELNPLRMSGNICANKLAITVFESYDDIVDKSCTAWRFFADDPERVASITSRTWATVIP